jgi:hypothetical protein
MAYNNPRPPMLNTIITGHLPSSDDLLALPKPEFILDKGVAKKLIEDALMGDADAHQAVCYIIVDYIDREKPLPKFLHNYLAAVLEHQTSRWPAATNGRGWDPVDRNVRDQIIRYAVGELVRVYSLGRTRNPATDKPSACSIVAKVLGELGVSIS